MSDAARAVGGAESPAQALVARLADGLRAAGFGIVDVKDRALLVDANGVKLMIGVEVTK